MVLDLDEKEREIVRHALEILEEELKSERVRTDRREWRAALHEDEDAIKRILEKVSLS